MSRPPRFPLQSKPLSPSAPEFNPKNVPKKDQNLTEKPSWLDNLLTEPKKIPNLNPLRRSISDSEVILETLTTYQGDFARNFELESLPEIESLSEMERIEPGFESGCFYGPNSPREKSRLTSSESSMVTAVLENVPSNPLQYLVLDMSSESTGATGELELSNSAGFNDTEKASRRRSGQRSRVRKLQYIAELERTVDSLQNLGAELAARIATLFQLRAALSVENKSLRKQIASLRHEKVIKDGKLQTLRNEAERLKQISSGRHRRSRSSASCSDMVGPSCDTSASPINWHMLDFDLSKLNLSGNPVPSPRHGFDL